MDSKQTSRRNWNKILFTLLGAGGLLYIVHDYGYDSVLRDIHASGWFSILLILTFLPTLACYSVGWLLVTEVNCSTPKEWFREGLHFIRMTASSIAWNNLTPFFKVGGEPAKVFMLTPSIGQKKALKSVVIYNIVHLLGTVGAFILCAFLIPIVFDVSDEVKVGCRGLGAIGVLFFVILYYFPFFANRVLRDRKVKKFRKTFYWFKWSLHHTERFYHKHRQRFILSVGLEVFARFVEGLTFYVAFWLIEKPVTFLTSVFLDVGRAICDNLFFFVPYQVGIREGSVLILMKDVFLISPEGYLTTVFMYRFVEISWIVIGYILWVRSKSSAKSVILPSAVQSSVSSAS